MRSQKSSIRRKWHRLGGGTRNINPLHLKPTKIFLIPTHLLHPRRLKATNLPDLPIRPLNVQRRRLVTPVVLLTFTNEASLPLYHAIAQLMVLACYFPLVHRFIDTEAIATG